MHTNEKEELDETIMQVSLGQRDSFSAAYHSTEFKIPTKKILSAVTDPWSLFKALQENIICVQLNGQKKSITLKWYR